MQQPLQPQRKNKNVLAFIGGCSVVTVVIVVIVFVVLSIINSFSTTSSSSATTTSSTQNTNVTHHFTVGQTATIGNTWEITVRSAKTSHGDQYTTPSADNEYLIIDVSAKNISQQEQSLSSIANFSLQDATGQQYTETLLSSATAPDGKVEAGGLLRGQLVYEVPATQTDFTFHFQADIITGGLTTWDIHV